MLAFPRLIRYFCELAGVSRSGFYAWKKSEEKRAQNEERDEADLKRYETLEELKAAIYDSIDDYNNYRYQWTLNKMTPAQYRSHLLSA